MTRIAHIGLDRNEIERRKQLVRDLWAGRPVDHLPVLVNVVDSSPGPSIREQFLDGDKQLAAALRTVELTWKAIPNGDVIPAIRPDVGCSCLATAFGADLYWGDDPNQTCGIKVPPITDLDAIADLPAPPPDAGQLAGGIDRVRRFAEAGEGLIAVSLLDMAGGLNVANDLLGAEMLYLALIDEPRALECLLGKIQELFIATIDRQIQAAGGEDRITTTDFPDYWFPEGRKGHVSDDISANISPAAYRQFSIPYHNMVFARYGGGGLHNCGPNPCLAPYLEHTPPIRAIDLSYTYSRSDLPKIKDVCRKRAMVYLGEFPSQPDLAIEEYRRIMELMTPDVIVVPALCVPSDADAAGLYRRMRPIAEEYAKRMDWGWQSA